VRNGSVVDLQVGPGRVTALVSGSTMYDVKVTVGSVPRSRWSAICEDCSGAIDSLVELLQGRFSKGVMARLCEQKTGLFPSPKDIIFTCSCPDWASMCKHVAAVLYGIGARLDHQPELLFMLRKVDQQDLIANAGADLSKKGRRPAGAKVLASDDLSEMFGIEIAPATPPKRSETARSRDGHRRQSLLPCRRKGRSDLAGEVDENCVNERRSGTATDTEEATSDCGAHAQVLGRAQSRREEAEDFRVAMNQP
jgi:uncharacterized Zn finger protein